MSEEFRTKLGNVRMKDTGAARSMVMSDSLMNIATGMGGGLDPQSHAFYGHTLIAQPQIENAYRTSAFTKRVHVIPATDAVRAWRTFQAEDTDITLIEAEEKRLGLQAKVRRAEIVARMYGGSVMLMGTKDGNLALPLNVETVKKGDLRYIHVISKNRVSVPNLILDPGSIYMGQPDLYYVNGGTGAQIPVHPSRIIRYIHGDLPDDILETQGGWGDPLLTSLFSTLTNADTAQGQFASLLSKTLIDTVYVPGLTEMAATTEGEEMLKRRFVVAKLFESMLHVKLLDAPATVDSAGERWETRQAVWTGIPEVGRMFLQMLAGASGIPLTRLMGSSADGMNATGEGDQNNYFEAVSSGQELDLRPRLDMIDAVLIRSALGAMPETYTYSFNPLSVDSDEVKAKNAKARAEATKIYVDSGAVPIEVMQEGIKNQLIESGEYPGLEDAYDQYAAGNLDPLIEVEEVPEDPLIPVDPTTGQPTQNRESRLFSANDCMHRLLADGMNALEAFTEARRLTDVTPRTLYVSRPVVNADDISAWAKEQEIPDLNENLHASIYLTFDQVDWLKAGSAWNQDDKGNMVIAPGGPRLIEPLGRMGAVLFFAASEISWRHESIKRDTESSYPYSDFQPHISLTKTEFDWKSIKPYKGKIILGPEEFQGAEQ